ncbi:MAG: oxidoreductase [Chitinophagaceae bacterium]|nr:oxidoreductase [Chitinophagaceae bacterium]MCW5927630.1 oxidoreductase [Chitinophagaceae bacterium]
MAQAQSIQVLSDSATASLRGLSVVNDNIVWVSGSNGTVGRSIDGGETWKWMTVKGFEKVDFRDVEAFDGVTAVIMGTASPAYILKTINGGETWNMVFKDDRAAMFLDAMEFWNEESGIVIGDPVDGKIFVARSFDGGSTWQHIPEANYPVGEEGEVMFAASGTNIRAISLSEAAFVTGGKRSRIFIRDHKYDLPLLQGKETTGANSFAVYGSKKRKQSSHMVVAGGDFAADTVRAGNVAISRNGGKTWTDPVTPPAGYRSCVEYISRKKIITCGTTGVDISLDGGENWKLISTEGFHVCRKAKAGRSVFLAGAGGRVAKLVW